MKIGTKIARKYWELAAKEQVMQQLQIDGFTVEYETLLAGMRADLVAKKDDTLLVYEFKTSDWSEERVEEAKRVRNHVVHKLGGGFRLVWVTPPRERDIEIDGLADMLCELLSEPLHQDLDLLSTHTRVDDVIDVEVLSARLSKDSIRVRGEGLVVVQLMFGSGADNAGETQLDGENYPFTFEIGMDSRLNVHEVFELRVDTSSYYD